MCEFCENLTNEPRQYQESIYGKLSLVRYGCKTILLVEPNMCPPYARCSAKNIPIRIGYEINCCPNCGADMRKKEKENEHTD